MKKHLLSFVLLLSLITQTKAQTSVYHPFPDSDAVWNVHYFLFGVSCDSEDDYYSYVITSDTTIGSNLYHKLTVPFVNRVLAGYGSDVSVGYAGGIRQNILKQKSVYHIA